MGSHTHTDKVTGVENIGISALQINRLHRIHVVDINTAVDWVLAVPHVETIITYDDLIAYRFPFSTPIEALV